MVQAAALLPSPVEHADVSQVEYLTDMSADLHELEACTDALQSARPGQTSSRHEDSVRRGNSLASKCCNW